MLTAKLATGVVHDTPKDLRKALLSSKSAHGHWEDITPLARNEWICWVENAKHIETRNRRISQTVDKINAGKRRPCCWAGCMHRQRG